jgi:hypothetical protein
MGQRLELHAELVSLLGTNNVYYQPPATVQLHYPAIIYELSSITTRNADNMHYINTRRYSVTVIDTNPDSILSQTILDSFERCTFDRRFASDNLYHDVLTLYY